MKKYIDIKIDKERFLKRLKIEKNTKVYESANIYFENLYKVLKKNANIIFYYIKLESKDIPQEINSIINCNKYILCLIYSEDKISEIAECMITKGDYLKGYLINEMLTEAIFYASDKVNEQINKKLKLEKSCLSKMYAAGDGEIDIVYQKTFLEELKKHFEINVFVNDDYMILPCNSLIYIFGIKDLNCEDDCYSEENKCNYCKNLKCQYRKCENKVNETAKIQYKVNFINQNKIIYVDENTLISNACKLAGFSLDLVCNGMGICKKCEVTIEKNKEKLKVLSCSTYINSDVNIYLDEKQYKLQANILNNYEEIEINFSPNVRKKCVSYNILKKMTGQYIDSTDLSTFQKFSKLINSNECKGITFVSYKNKLVDVSLNDTSKYLYGCAIDIGSTSVVVYIYNLNTGKLLKTYSDLNKQISYGADIISRVNYAMTEDGLFELHIRIIETINNIIDIANNELENFKENLYNIILCGNTVMQHLFFNMRVDSLGNSPFTSITKDYITCFASDVKLNCNSKCKVEFLPLLGGFVGADTTSCLLAIQKYQKENILLIDLGTNGEIAIGNENKYYVSSTSCGPALEGGNIECGMRATEGAIEKFFIENDEIIIKTIGEKFPIGICGSGIIDIVAWMLRYNIIDKTGKIYEQDEFKLKNTSSSIYKRIQKINGVNCFVVSNLDANKKIYISQNDIRQIQLAKSSIYSGCISLLNLYKKDINYLDKIIISGAFGNYIDIENAMYIGLIPNYKEKIIQIGNGAGKGVCMYLLDESVREKCDIIVKNVQHHDLANDDNFTKIYIENINF